MSLKTNSKKLQTEVEKLTRQLALLPPDSCTEHIEAGNRLVKAALKQVKELRQKIELDLEGGVTEPVKDRENIASRKKRVPRLVIDSDSDTEDESYLTVAGQKHGSDGGVDERTRSISSLHRNMFDSDSDTGESEDLFETNDRRVCASKDTGVNINTNNNKLTKHTPPNKLIGSVIDQDNGTNTVGSDSNYTLDLEDEEGLFDKETEVSDRRKKQKQSKDKHAPDKAADRHVTATGVATEDRDSDDTDDLENFDNSMLMIL